MSPARTVYVRVHDVARAVVIVSEEKGLRTTGNPPGTTTEETATAMREKTSILASTSVVKNDGNDKSADQKSDSARFNASGLRGTLVGKNEK
jgi:hypothetical protein